MRKVTAPSRKEVQATTAVVIVTVFLFGVYFWIVDNVIGTGVDTCSATLRTANGKGSSELMQDDGRTKKTNETRDSRREGRQLRVAEAPRNPNMKWYIIHSYSGFERKVKESLESRVQRIRLAGKDRQSADPDRVGH